ncbi:hypothetical protein KJ966_18565 [bacterium]|nr:hypothetical protein [bacterium]
MKSLIPLFRILLCFTGAVQFCHTTLLANDFISISSSDSAVLNKSKGTALLNGNVEIVHKSTGSTLITDELFLIREKDSGDLAYAKAKGSVKMDLNSLDEYEQLERTTHVICDQALYDKIKAVAELKGNVEVISHDYKINADIVYYDLEKETGRITEIPGKKVRMVFYKNRPQAETKAFDLTDTQGLVDGQAIEIKLNKKLNKLIFQGDVRFFDHDEKALFTSKKADLFFNNKDELEKIIAYGNVILSQPQRNSASDRADFDYLTEIVTLTGNARLKEVDQLEVFSSVIRLHMDETKGMVESGVHVPVKMKAKVD